jgi:hypothetical protein
MTSSKRGTCCADISGLANLATSRRRLCASRDDPMMLPTCLALSTCVACQDWRQRRPRACNAIDESSACVCSWITWRLILWRRLSMSSCGRRGSVVKGTVVTNLYLRNKTTRERGNRGLEGRGLSRMRMQICEHTLGRADVRAHAGMRHARRDIWPRLTRACKR